MPTLTARQIAEICGGDVEGDAGLVISGANTLDQAGPSDLSFAESPKAFKAALNSRAGCLIVPRVFDASRTLIRTDNARAAFARSVAALFPRTTLADGVHASAIISDKAAIGQNCAVGAYATIGPETRIGSGCQIAAGCRIGANVVIGNETVLHPNVTIYDNVRIGSRVIIHAGSVIGADGFGFTFTGVAYEKFPQVGTVEIGDDVEVGANCCIDRAALGVTRIGTGTKLDNLIHIAHNCTIGRHVVVAAQTGFSGSVTVGDYAAIGGQAGIGEKAKIDAKAIVGGKAGILTSQHVGAGEPVWGIPARPLKQHLRGLAHVARLPKLHEELKALKKRLAELESAAGEQR